MAMRISVKTRTGETPLVLKDGASVRDAMAALKINDETVLIKVNRAVAHPSTILKEGDALELVHIIFGG